MIKSHSLQVFLSLSFGLHRGCIKVSNLQSEKMKIWFWEKKKFRNEKVCQKLTTLKTGLLIKNIENGFNCMLRWHVSWFWLQFSTFCNSIGLSKKYADGVFYSKHMPKQSDLQIKDCV